jgi:C4-dicarboxylate-specific signal transduction histidine kinase
VSAPIHTLATAQNSREALSEEIARLELLRRLALGAAHTFNNAFTAILGETLCLADERKDDPLVSEACDLIQGEVERCARLTRSIAARVQRRESTLEETNIASLARGLESLLRETVSRSVAIAIEVPDVCVVVRGPGEDLELLVLLVAHRLARTNSRGAALHIALGPHDAATAELRLEVRIPEQPSEMPRPDACWDLLVADAVEVLGSRHGVRVVSAAGDGSPCVRLQFEIAPLTL